MKNKIILLFTILVASGLLFYVLQEPNQEQLNQVTVDPPNYSEPAVNQMKIKSVNNSNPPSDSENLNAKTNQGRIELAATQFVGNKAGFIDSVFDDNSETNASDLVNGNLNELSELDLAVSSEIYQICSHYLQAGFEDDLIYPLVKSRIPFCKEYFSLAPKKPENILEELYKRAQNGNLDARLIYFDQLTSAVDNDFFNPLREDSNWYSKLRQAITWQKQLSRLGVIEADKTLAEIYLQGGLVPKDLNLAEKYANNVLNKGGSIGWNEVLNQIEIQKQNQREKCHLTLKACHTKINKPDIVTNIGLYRQR